MKKLRIMSIVPILVLSSCSQANYAGTYQFRLGKTDGSHFEVTAVLTNDKYNEDGMKKMTLTADLGEDMSPTALIEKYGEQYPILEPFVDIMIDEIKDIKEIPFYYKVLNSKVAKYGNRLAIGTDFAVKKIDELKEKYEILKELFEELEIDETTFELKPDQTKYFFGAYVNSKALTFEIPVSVDDLNMQDFWYGKSTLISGDYVDRLPGAKGEERFGTHPEVKKDDKGNITKNECDEVNKIFEKEFSKTYLYQKDGEGLDVVIGSFVEAEVNGKKSLKCYLDSSYTESHTNIEGHVYTRNVLGEFDEKKDIRLSVNDDNTTSVTYNDKTGKDEAFIDENGNEFKFIDTMKEPFVFRDFHTVDLGLAKL